jgi:hypothetical protein
MKLRIYRIGVGVTSMFALLYAAGAPRKWG